MIRGGGPVPYGWLFRKEVFILPILFSENCVTVVDSEAAALSGADPAKKLYPARVIGPSRSSEGFRLYYLVCWLDGES